MSAKTSVSGNPEDSVHEILSLLINGNTVEYADRVIDKRFKDQQEAIDLYKLNHEFNPLVSYNILETEIVTNNSYNCKVELVYKSGRIYEQNLLLTLENDVWKLLLENHDLDEVETLNEIENDDIGILSGIHLVGWDMTIKSTLGTSNFVTPSRALILSIKSQYTTTSMEYRVWGIYSSGQEMLGSTRVYGNVTERLYSLGISEVPPKAYLAVNGSGSSRGDLYY